MRRVLLAGITLVFAIATIRAYAQVAGGSVAMGGTTRNSARIPYSADTVVINDQVLADGNHIHRETHGKFYRDSQGRTRTETEIFVPAGAKPFVAISINDPVQGVSIGINSRTQTAQINHFPDPQKAAAESSSARATSIPKVEMKREDLGTQEIDGELAHGTRFTRTIPSGAEGNEQPIEIVIEDWMSPELGSALLSKSTDPRNGTTERRLTNIQRGEPDPALFQIPADYKVKDNGTP